MAPERLNETTKPTREQLVRADIYGYGMVVWQVITDGGLPYEHVTRENVLFARKLNAMHNKPNSDWSPVDDVGKIPDDVPIIFRYLVDQCLASEPSHRPSLALVQKILNKYLAISAESRESPLDYSPSTEPLHYSPSTEPLDYSPSTEPLRHNPFTEILDDSSVTEILDCSSSTETLDYTEARDCSSSAEPLGYSPSESDFDSLIEFEEPNHNTFTKFEEPNRNEMKAEPLGGGTVKGEFTPTPATPSGSSTSRTGTRLTRGRNSSAAQRSERPSLSTLGSKSSTSKSRVSSPRLRQRTRAKLKEMLEQLYRGE
ncbi:hypothetical protein BC938DRAFT_477022 [Jimgerdemannia flammicorona]|uniref:Protein kinase domain-containing protein n=1 Tax=Jimgerdemannia flammicorona TaxID=994334 RepID=A0A433PCK1_9FUNG|nr:hypothetical protein BC938DRAFT_477022 [Jimgerdemannia flammicorona]